MLRVGTICQIDGCRDIPAVQGELGQIIDMQIQEEYRYSTYPLWLRMMSGENKGRIYGFNYSEITDASLLLNNLPPLTVA